MVGITFSTDGTLKTKDEIRVLYAVLPGSSYELRHNIRHPYPRIQCLEPSFSNLKFREILAIDLNVGPGALWNLLWKTLAQRFRLQWIQTYLRRLHPFFPSEKNAFEVCTSESLCNLVEYDNYWQKPEILAQLRPIFKWECSPESAIKELFTSRVGSEYHFSLEKNG